MPAFDPELLASRLNILPVRHRVAFCAAICERLLPNYEAFSQEERWGRPDVLRRALDVTWGGLQTGDILPAQASQLSRECFEVGPEPGEFKSDFASAALDAASATGTTVLCVLDGDVSRCVEVATYARDSVDMYIQMRDPLDYDDPEFEQRILDHPLMQREIELQLAQLTLLERADGIDGSVVTGLRSGVQGSLSLNT